MIDSAKTNPSVNDGNNSPKDEAVFAWGVDEIGRVIDRTGRQTNHLLATGQIKSAKKVGGRWVANRLALLREMGADSPHIATTPSL